MGALANHESEPAPVIRLHPDMPPVAAREIAHETLRLSKLYRGKTPFAVQLGAAAREQVRAWLGVA